MFRPKNTIALALSLIGLASLGLSGLSACSSTTTPPIGTGGAPASGGTVGSGGASGGTASGGTSSGGTSSGGTASGGTSSGGAATGGAASGGAASGGAGTGGAGTGGSGGGATAAFELTIDGIAAVDNDDCDAGAEAACPLFPQRNVSTFIQGENISPAMSWPEGPVGTLSYAVILHDLTATNAHWALWDIPAGTLELPEGLPTGATVTTPFTAKQAGIQGGYFGSGACGNVYEFKLYALDTATLDVASNAMTADVIAALEAASALDSSFVRVQSRDYCE